ncbi:MAG: flagellar hook-length control protein FliK [Rhodospirillales bacterium]|nr:flagellar hook-length control protein FliK [Rhodospirillales bacterium]
MMPHVTNKAMVTAARQPPQPPVPVEQIAVKIRNAVGDGADKINIKLNPSQLGRVEVRMEITSEGRLTAVVLAEKPETLEMLQRDARGLERALQEAGLRTDSNSLSFGLKSQNNTGTQQGHNRDSSHSGRPSERADTPEEHKDNGIMMNDNVYGRNLRANGGVDIRI